MNLEKLEVCFFGTGQTLSKTPLPSNCDSYRLPYHGVGQTKDNRRKLDTALTFDEYVNNVAKACNFNMWGLHNIRRSISRDVANTMAACIVGTRLDYCNALLCGATEKSLNK